MPLRFVFLLVFATGLALGADATGAQATISDLKARAEAGDRAATRQLAEAYYLGKDVPQDFGEAARWFRAAADGDQSASQAAAQYNLGVLYANGQGVDRDQREAARWYRASAEQGNTDAQFNLAVFYMNGVGVGRDLVQSYRWFALAAKAGDRDSAKAQERVAGRMSAEEIARAKGLMDEWQPCKSKAECAGRVGK
jgi:TPR repeat protein